jgi:FOG: CheY-like receiver
MMNGQIYVDSSYGHGTNFSFEISLEKQNESKRQGDRYKQFHANEAASVASQNMNILLVEDNDLNQQIVCELLESELFSVHVANNGKKAITLLEKSLKRNNRFH